MACSPKAHLFVGALIVVGGAALSTTQQRVTLGRVRPIVAPSVAKANFLALGAELETCAAAGCEWLHCSVQDGVFVPKVSFGHRPVSICYQRSRTNLIHAQVPRSSLPRARRARTRSSTSSSAVLIPRTVSRNSRPPVRTRSRSILRRRSSRPQSRKKSETPAWRRGSCSTPGPRLRPSRLSWTW